jgi:hypothetical protein
MARPTDTGGPVSHHGSLTYNGDPESHAMTAERWAQIEALYHAAQARPAGERVAFLAEACVSDEALQREVESLLAQPSAQTGVLNGPVAAAAGRLADVAADESLVGQRLGGYEFLALVAEGGQGQVYRARDLSLPREVAVKVLSPEFAQDAAQRARFRREAELLAAFTHRHIAQIHAFVEVDGRYCWRWSWCRATPWRPASRADPCR